MRHPSLLVLTLAAAVAAPAVHAQQGAAAASAAATPAAADAAALAAAFADTSKSDDWGTAPTGRLALVAQVGPEEQPATVRLEVKDGKLGGVLHPGGEESGAPAMPLMDVTAKGRELVLQLQQGNGGVLTIMLRRKGALVQGRWENADGQSGTVSGSVR